MGAASKLRIAHEEVVVRGRRLRSLTNVDLLALEEAIRFVERLESKGVSTAGFWLGVLRENLARG